MGRCRLWAWLFLLVNPLGWSDGQLERISGTLRQRYLCCERIRQWLAKYPSGCLYSQPVRSPYSLTRHESDKRPGLRLWASRRRRSQRRRQAQEKAGHAGRALCAKDARPLSAGAMLFQVVPTPRTIESTHYGYGGWEVRGGLARVANHPGRAGIHTKNRVARWIGPWM